MEAKDYKGAWKEIASQLVSDMQMRMLQEREALWSIRQHTSAGAWTPSHLRDEPSELDNQITDAIKTASNHIDALQHIVGELSSLPNTDA